MLRVEGAVMEVLKPELREEREMVLGAQGEEEELH